MSNKLVWMKHPFGSRNDPGLDTEIEEWINQKYAEGYRICAMPLHGRWAFERREFDDGK